MSEWYDRGYREGFDDGVNGRPSKDSVGSIFLEFAECALGGHTEEDWNEGYRDGYEAGCEEREASTPWF